MVDRDPRLDALDVFVGTWSMEAVFDDLPPAEGDARVEFAWLTGGQFLVQRWSLPVPEAPDGIALIGIDPATDDRYLQHYFDSRGVARVYRMTLDGGTWTLWRVEPDFSPLDFGQRYVGTIAADGRTIAGQWQISHDATVWVRDFDLSYRKLDG